MPARQLMLAVLAICSLQLRPAAAKGTIEFASTLTSSVLGSPDLRGRELWVDDNDQVVEHLLDHWVVGS